MDTSLLFGLLAVTGLRISEALHLRSTDVDWSEGILTIRDAKFGKSRLIPLQASTLKVLADYGARRDRIFVVRKSPFFFCSRYDGRLDEGQVRRVFYMISRQIGIRGASASRRPRLPDFRQFRCPDVVALAPQRGRRPAAVAHSIHLSRPRSCHRHLRVRDHHTRIDGGGGAAGKLLEKRWKGVI